MDDRGVVPMYNHVVCLVKDIPSLNADEGL